MYYKETAFILVCGISAPAIFIRAYDVSARRIDLNKLRNPKCALDLMLFILALIFLSYYLLIMLRTGLGHKYIEDAKLPLSEIIALYLKSDLLLPLLIVAVVGRAAFLIRTRQCPYLFWDGCAFAALLYMLAYFVLRLFSPYYMAPVDLITLLYVSHWLIPAWPRLSRLEKLTISGVTAVVVIQILAFSNMKLVERKNLISAQVDIANFLVSEYARNGSKSLHLFFPFSDTYSRQEFASYLRYRGLEPEREIQSEKQPFNIIISSPVDPREDRRCLPWLNYVCRQQDEPRSGDLVVVLPDDGASFDQLRNLVGDKEPALQVYPIPRSPGFFVALARLVRPLQPNLPFTGTVNISDAWLHAFVFRWP
ncbi:hypothetical protein [Methyloterricola oryzae]|uniref:hypothetical protein n=1 Tax=Methyloterricola oryzae TaxID=1495050 RepID=UPI0011AF96C2|nr:hypothetical protein [Methyloterricola oryzae]